MHTQLEPIQRFVSLLSVGGMVLLGLGIVVLIFVSVKLIRNAIGKRKPPPPKHQIAFTAVQPKWTEAAYQRAMEVLFTEVQEAIERSDLETLAVISEGRALGTFKHDAQSRQPQDPREVLAGSAIQSWDEKSQKMITLFLVGKHVGRWRQFRELWTLEKRGRGWFVIDRQAATKSK
jgi:hypothetical protein